MTGFEGSGEAALGLVQGEVDAYSRSLNSQLPDVEAGDARAVLVMGSQPAEELPEVPTVMDFANDDTQRDLLEFHSRLIESGRAFAAPPGMPKDCLDELRAAYEATVTDDAFVAKSERAGRPVAFASGEEVQQEVKELMNAPKAYADILKEAYRAG